MTQNTHRTHDHPLFFVCRLCISAQKTCIYSNSHSFSLSLSLSPPTFQNVADVNELAARQFRAKSHSLSLMTPYSLVNGDVKMFKFDAAQEGGGGDTTYTVAYSVIETTDADASLARAAEIVPEIETTEDYRRNTKLILDQMNGPDPPLVLLFENYEDSVKLLQRKLDWTFENEENLKDAYSHPPFEAWPHDVQEFVNRRIRLERLDEVYTKGKRLFLKALKEEGIPPRRPGAWVAFRDTIQDEGDHPLPQPVATEREELGFMRCLRGAQTWDYRP